MTALSLQKLLRIPYYNQDRKTRPLDYVSSVTLFYQNHHYFLNATEQLIKLKTLEFGLLLFYATVLKLRPCEK